MGYLFRRLAEPSSWAGIGAIIASAAQAVATKDPTAIGATVAGLAALVMPEARKQ